MSLYDIKTHHSTTYMRVTLVTFYISISFLPFSLTTSMPVSHSLWTYMPSQLKLADKICYIRLVQSLTINLKTKCILRYVCYIKWSSTLKQRLHRSEYVRDCIVRYSRPSASYTIILLYALVNKYFDQYTYKYMFLTNQILFWLFNCILHDVSLINYIGNQQYTRSESLSYPSKGFLSLCCFTLITAPPTYE